MSRSRVLLAHALMKRPMMLLRGVGCSGVLCLRVKDGPKPLRVRIWRCPGCGTWLDRDINAAVNIAKAAGLAVSACGA
jgi:hypothetical protein